MSTWINLAICFQFLVCQFGLAAVLIWDSFDYGTVFLLSAGRLDILRCREVVTLAIGFLRRRAMREALLFAFSFFFAKTGHPSAFVKVSAIFLQA